METNEASPAKETNPLNFVKLELENPKMAETARAEAWSGWLRSKTKQIRPRYCTDIKSI